MPDNASTDFENDRAYLDPEDWQIAFEPYKGNPDAVLTLGYNLTELKRLIDTLNPQGALSEINVAIDCLYDHSDFRSVSRELFQTAIEGKLTTEKEALLRQLGLRI